MSKFDGIYQNVPFGFAWKFEELGWEPLLDVYAGPGGHGQYGVMFRWTKETDPIFPTGWRKVA